MLQAGYSLSLDARGGAAYRVHDATEIESFRKAIEELPANEAPDLFGLHPNAELSFRTLQACAEPARAGVACCVRSTYTYRSWASTCSQPGRQRRDWAELSSEIFSHLRCQRPSFPLSTSQMEETVRIMTDVAPLRPSGGAASTAAAQPDAAGAAATARPTREDAVDALAKELLGTLPPCFEGACLARGGGPSGCYLACRLCAAQPALCHAAGISTRHELDSSARHATLLRAQPRRCLRSCGAWRAARPRL